MIRKTIAYKDYNGIERKEDFYFNLSRAELIDMEYGTEGGYTAKLQKIADSKDAPTIMKTFKDIIMRSYGIKSDDGRTFRKSREISESFEQSEAYSVLLMELMTDLAEGGDKAAKFINAIVNSEAAADSTALPAVSTAKA